MVCPIKSNEIKQLQKRQRAQAEAAGCPDDVVNLLEALRSSDPAVRREAARMMEISSLAALNAADQWRTESY